MNKCKIVTFTYKKDNGEVTQRRGITLGYTRPSLALVADISDAGFDAMLEQDLRFELEEAHKKYLKEVAKILEEWDIVQKTFKVSGITDEKEVLLRDG
jgi:hypothetical protein